MDKHDIINHYKGEISRMQVALSVLEPLESGYLYEFKDKFQSENTQRNEWRYLVRLLTFNTLSVRFEVFACTQVLWNFKTVRTSDKISTTFWSITELKKINIQDLPLYVGWAWKSAEFEKLLAGKSRIRLRKD